MQVHYESLHPCSNADILATIDLVKEYLENRYRYSKKDLPSLLEPGRDINREIAPSEPSNQQQKLKLNLPHSSRSNFDKDKSKIEAVDMDLEEITQEEVPSDDNVGIEENKNYKSNSPKKMKLLPHSTKMSDTANLTYRLKKHDGEHPIMEDNNKRICPFCKASVKNIKIHFDRAKTCGDKIDMDHFSQLHKTSLQEKRKHQIRIAVQKRKEKLRAEDPEKFKEANRKASAKSKQKSRNENPEKFNEQNRKADTKSKQKRRDENPEKFDEDNRKSSVKYQEKRRHQNPQKFDEDLRNASRKYWGKMKANIDETERLRRFNMKIWLGPIFICSCCKRKLFENGVTKITDDFKQSITSKKPLFYINCIPKEEEVNIILNGSGEKSGSYICQTCKKAMSTGKVPSMSIRNGLHLTHIDQDCQLTELENNLIAQNINFQYIFHLKKSRWAATKKQMISVPVAVDKVLNTIHQLPRLPREAGLIPIKLKRKKIYDRAHKSEYINPQKIFKVLNTLKRVRSPILPIL